MKSFGGEFEKASSSSFDKLIYPDSIKLRQPK